MADVRATPLPQVGSQLRPVLDRAAARSTGLQAVAPQVPQDTEMRGLLQGLSQFNGALGQYTQEQVAKETERASNLAKQQAAADAASAAADADYSLMVSGPLPANVPLAHGDSYRDTLGALLADRVAVKARGDVLTAYADESKNPDFNASEFFSRKRGEVLDNISNPNIKGRVGMKFVDLENAVMQAEESKRVQRLTETENEALFTHLSENVRADMEPGAVQAEFSNLKMLGKQMGRSNKEMTQMFLGRLAYLSEKKGGDPSLFDVFDTVDPATGKPLLALGGPELQAQVSQMRDQAKAKQFKMLEKDTQQENFKNLAQLNEMLDKSPDKITPQMVAANIGDHGVFPSYREAASFLHQAQKAAAEKAGQAEFSTAYANGTLGRYPEGVQKAELERQLGPAITQLWNSASTGDATAASQLSALVMNAQTTSRSTVPVEALERLIKSSLTAAPNPDGPDGGFQTAAALYKALSADPKYRDTYFNDDANTLFRNYETAVRGGSDPIAAYKTAYDSISPAAKAAAEKLAKDPEFAKTVQKATKDVIGSSWWPRLLGGNGRITNQSYVESEAALAIKDMKSRNPGMADDTMQDEVGKWVSKNFIMDPVTSSAIKVPPRLADDTTREAIGEYAKRLKDAYKFDGDWQVQFRPAGDDGLVHVVLANGAAQKGLGTIPIQTIRDAYVGEKTVNPHERAIAVELKRQADSGKLDPSFIETNRAAIARLRKLNSLPSSVMDNVEKFQMETVQKNLASIPQMSLGPASVANLQHVPSRGVRVDNKLTADVAYRAANAPTFGGAYAGLAQSLITMGEAVVLKASDDPNPAAGKNIGMGYNLKANANNVHADLKRAGVAEDRIEQVIKGEAQLTPSQAERLLQISMPRYEKLAVEAAERTAPGLWDRMTAPQKAVMVDIAWQTGNPEQFKKAWSALAAGNAEGFRDASKVFYTNNKGEKVEDKRRGELRANMLAGQGTWLATVKKFGNFPSNAIESVALDNQK